jgi:hypothetical protein
MNLIKIIQETNSLPSAFTLNSGEKVVLSECSIPTGGYLLYYHEVESGTILVHEVGKTKEQAQENLKESIISLSM